MKHSQQQWGLGLYASELRCMEVYVIIYNMQDMLPSGSVQHMYVQP